mmetsp:Transcript_117816/g.185206  ORF Transcript_117816/g.185206 Transcript_117816/m.185206 type:complete len:81 (+) Transcript_117816:673-915(+)
MALATLLGGVVSPVAALALQVGQGRPVTHAHQIGIQRAAAMSIVSQCILVKAMDSALIRVRASVTKGGVHPGTDLAGIVR